MNVTMIKNEKLGLGSFQQTYKLISLEFFSILFLYFIVLWLTSLFFAFNEDNICSNCVLGMTLVYLFKHELYSEARRC